MTRGIVKAVLQTRVTSVVEDIRSTQLLLLSPNVSIERQTSWATQWYLEQNRCAKDYGSWNWQSNLM